MYIVITIVIVVIIVITVNVYNIYIYIYLLPVPTNDRNNACSTIFVTLLIFFGNIRLFFFGV
jgi:hypothetical protein